MDGIVCIHKAAGWDWVINKDVHLLLRLLLCSARKCYLWYHSALSQPRLGIHSAASAITWWCLHCWRFGIGALMRSSGRNAHSTAAQRLWANLVFPPRQPQGVLQGACNIMRIVTTCSRAASLHCICWHLHYVTTSTPFDWKCIVQLNAKRTVGSAVSYILVKAGEVRRLHSSVLKCS